MNRKLSDITSIKALKSGIWYTASTFLTRGLAFITVPIFTRLLTPEEYGGFNVFASWMSLLFIIVSCDFQTSVIRSKLDYADTLDEYISTILLLSSLNAVLISLVIFACKSFFFNDSIKVVGSYSEIIFFYLLFSPAWHMYASKCRAFYKYKEYSFLSALCAVSSVALSLLLVFKCNDRLWGRIFGQYSPEIIVGFFVYVFILFKGHSFRLNYAIYALRMCLPLVPHLLSLSLLSSSDKIIIGNLLGEESVAHYSIAVMCAHILSILLDTLNKAWAPWFLDALHFKEHIKIKNAGIIYFNSFTAFSCGVILLGPEIIRVLGGVRYLKSVDYLPALISGCVLQFGYSMFVQCEIYCKKTITIAAGTLLAALLNIGLNFLLIPKYGVIAASYTTLIGYMFLFLYHREIHNRLGFKDLFDNKSMIAGIILVCLLILIAPYFYFSLLLRLFVLLAYIFAELCLTVYSSDILNSLFKRLK